MTADPTATNPFEDEDDKYFVLVNAEAQHSLWPDFAEVPDGWEVIYGEDGRQECLDFVEGNWTDMRPKSLIDAMEADAATRRSGDSMNGEDAMSSAEEEAAGKK